VGLEAGGLQTLFDRAKGPADTGNYESRILSITHLGDAATAPSSAAGAAARVEEAGQQPVALLVLGRRWRTR
jgi:hypothetical protein